ncbi:hypothetical protein J7J84_01035 [bacterium]|nr:hypothetical protein [bacterium]
MTLWRDYFGLLPEEWHFTSDYYRIGTFGNTYEILMMTRDIISDGWLCPTLLVKAKRYGHPEILQLLTAKYEEEDNEYGLEVEWGRTISSDVVVPFTSHYIELINNTEREPRLGSAALLVHFIGFLAGTRLQFEGWALDSRVPIWSQCRDETRVFVPHRPKILEKAYHYWRGLSNKKRKALLSALYVHEKAYCETWEWERFLWEYFCFDALWNVFVNNNTARTKHPDRMRTFASHYGIPLEKTAISEIVKLRNELVHEALWDNRLLGHGDTTSLAINAPLNLRRLNKRLIAALILGHNKFSSSCWWTASSPVLSLGQI